MTYLRCSIGKWEIDLLSNEAKEVFRSIDEEGVRVFRKQPGFIQYRLMLADPHTTVAVAEWESEELGKKGAENYRNWLRSSGIWDKLVLQTYDGEVVAAS
jgi:DNA gyrase inhibitor GyrI